MNRRISTMIMAMMVIMAMVLGACADTGQDDTGGGFGEPGTNETAVGEPGLDTTPNILEPTEEILETESVVTLEPTLEPTATEAMLETTPTLQPLETEAATPTITAGGGDVLPTTGRVVPVRLTVIEGQSIKSLDGEILGSIEDVLIDLSTRRIEYIAVDATDVLNVADPDGLILIPWDTVVYSADGTFSGANLGAAGEITGTQTLTGTEVMTDTTGTGATGAVGTPTVFYTTVGVDMVEAAPAILQDEIGNVTGPNWTEGWDAEFTDYWDPILADQTAVGEMDTTGTVTGTEMMTGTQTMTGTTDMNANMALSGVITADNLLGMNVQTESGETLGEIEEAIVDAASGRIQFVIVTAGEILGLGGKDVPVPLQALSGNPADEAFTFTAPITEESFEELPDFELEEMTDEELSNWHQLMNDYWNTQWPDLELNTP